MAYINFRKVKLADWNSMNSMNKDPNTRYTVFNTDGTIYGEFIGEKPVVGGANNSVGELLNKKVDKTTTINKLPLSGNIVLDSDDIMLPGGITNISNKLQDVDEEIALKANKADLASFVYNNAEGVDENNYRYKPGIKEDDEAELQIEGKKLYKSLLLNGDFKLDSDNDGIPDNFSALALTDSSLQNGIYTGTATSSYARLRQSVSKFVAGNKYYGSFFIKNTRRAYIQIGSSADISISIADPNVWSFISGIKSASGTCPWWQAGQSSNTEYPNTFSMKSMNLFNITEMIEDKLYSPMFDTTFDLMDDDEIKEQMDAWVKGSADYLASGGWTDFKTNTVTNLLGKRNKIAIRTKADDGTTVILMKPMLDGSIAGSYGAGDFKTPWIKDNKYLLLVKHNQPVETFGEGLYYYIQHNIDGGGWKDKGTSSYFTDGMSANTFKSEVDGYAGSNFRFMSTNATYPFVIYGMVLLDLTALGDEDLSVTQAYEKYGPMFDHLAKGPNMFPTNVEVVEGSSNLAMPDLTGKTDLGDGVYLLSDNNGIKLEYNSKTGEFHYYGTVTANHDLWYIKLTESTVLENVYIRSLDSGLYIQDKDNKQITSSPTPKFLPTFKDARNYLKEGETVDNTFKLQISYNEDDLKKEYHAPMIDGNITLGTFNPAYGEFQELKYTPRNGASLFFNDLEDGDSQPLYAKDTVDLSSTRLKFTDNDITDDWASIISKTNSSAEKVREHDERIVDLEDVILSEQYNTQVGVTSKEFKYYNLSGLKKDSNVKLHGKGQMIKNMVSHSIKTQTVDGLTITYDESTGYINLNGTYTGKIRNIDLVVNPPIDAAPGEWLTLIRYYGGGTVDLKGAYIGYVLQGSSVSHRINENSEALYDPYISSSGVMVKDNTSGKDDSGKVYKQRIIFQIWKTGMVFNNFKFRLALYKGSALQGYALPAENGITSEVEVFNRTINSLSPSLVSVPTSTTRGLTFEYNEDAQTFMVNGTASSTGTIDLTKNISTTDGQRLSLTRYFVSGETTIGGTVAAINIEGTSTVTMNQITDDNYWKTNHATGTKTDDGNVKIQLAVVSGQVYDNYTFKLMLSEESTPIAKYVNYKRVHAGFLALNGSETSMNDFIEFPSIPYGVIEITEIGESQDLQYGFSISDLANTTLEYSSEIFSSNLDTSILTERTTNLDNPFRGKIIAIWGDSRESNNPTSEVGGGSQLDTSWPTLLGNKLGASVLNFGLSGGSWAVNTVQSDAEAAIVNRVETQDPNASADIIIISSFNDFKLYTPLGSSDPSNVDKTTYYGAMRTTYKKLYEKYPGKRIYLILPQKRYDENTTYSTGASYKHYRDAQIEVANEYSIPIIDLYDLMPGKKGTQAYNTYMLNDTHWNAVGNERVAELVARHLIGGGNTVSRKELPPLPQSNGNYVLKLVITNGIPSFSWEKE